MLNETFAISPLTDNACLLEWTAANADDVSYVFVNGEIVGEAMTFSADARSAQIPLPVGVAATVEIHDVPAGVEPGEIFSSPLDRPLLRWSAAAMATKYHVYHAQAGGAETLLAVRYANAGALLYEFRCQIELTKNAWHFFRVEAADESGNESTRASWRFFSYAPPDPAANVKIENGASAGTFNITITE